MSDDGVIDWRIWKSARVSEDTVLHGEEIKQGTAIYVVSMTRDSTGVMRTFITPSPTSLALSISIRAALEAARLKPTLWQVEPSSGMDANEAKVASTFAYFEECMIAATFAFQSLEAFANQLIAENQSAPIEVERRGEKKLWTPQEVERNCSTEEKYSEILPRLGTIKSPKGSAAWEGFVKLKRLRDSTVHLKAGDQYVRNKEDKESLYHRFLNHSPKEFPRSAITVIRHYTPKENDAWIRGAEARLG